MATLSPTTADSFTANNAATAPHHAVRLTEFQTALSGVAPVSHQHVAANITDFAAATKIVIGLYIVDGDTVTWYADGTYYTASVKLKTGGGLLSDTNGVYVNVGSGVGAIAAGDHTHAQLHDPVTLGPSLSLGLTLNGQILAGEVILAPNGGLKATISGVAVDFGSSHTQVARGDISGSGVGPTFGASSTMTLTEDVNGNVTGAVKLSASPSAGNAPLTILSDGLAVPLGTTASTPAAGNHTHGLATESADGFLSAADKRTLDQMLVLLQLDQSVSFTRHDACPAAQTGVDSGYIGGRHRWGTAMQILNANVVALAPTANVTLGLELNGVVQETLTIPSGTPNTEVNNFKDYTSDDLVLPANTYARWRVLSGVGVIENEASRVNISLSLRPSISSFSAIRINCGGGAQSPYVTDAYFDSGAAQTTSHAIDLTGVTNPAPLAVYQSCRRQTFTQSPVNYVIPGLARGVTYTVRLHFADFINDSFGTPMVGAQRFDINVIGATTSSVSLYDICAAVGNYVATVQEFTTTPDTNGAITVQLVPRVPTGGWIATYACQINGIELIPQS